MNHPSLISFGVALSGAMVLAGAAEAAAPLSISSPDGRIVVEISTPDGADTPVYKVVRDGETVIASSPMGLDLAYDKPLDGLTITGATRGSEDRTYPLTATKASSARDRYNAMSVDLRERAGGRVLKILFRAYDDGVAFRYLLPAQPGISKVSIRNEKTQFNFPADYACRGLNLGRMDLSHEGEYEPVKASATRWHNLYDPPFSCTTTSGRTSFVLAEADLRDYAALYLRGRNDGGLGMQAQLSLRYDDRSIAVRRDMSSEGVQSPWRVVMMADRAGDLIASNLIGNLNPQSAIADTSWIKPGKAAWDWWSGPYVPPPGKGAMDMATLERYIDFAAKAGARYMLIDEGWSLNSGVAGSAPQAADITRTKPDLDMPALVAYAKARNVDLLLWLQWSLLDKRMDEALDRYRDWGIKGVKVDFMDRDDQEMVAFYHRLLAAAAQRQLLVNLHGAYHPTGLNRTYPNFITQEGVLGAEYNKWSTRVTATHNVTLPFTRMLLGPMDYTPGGFRNRSPASFKIVNSPPQVQTTRGQALAMYVVYDSPVQALADSPDAYENADGFDFLQVVPTAWDETRFIAGDTGDYVVLARRKGQDWYLGAMTNETGRKISVPLSFLGAGRFKADIYEDGAEPTSLKIQRELRVTNDTALDLTLASGGGAAARITAVR